MRLRRDYVVAGLELADKREGDRRHAGRRGARGLGAFERRHALLEHLHGRIGEAGILVARIFALEARFGLGGVVVDVALGQEQRLGGLAELRAQRAGMDQASFRTVVSSLRTRTCGPPLASKTKPGREEKSSGRAHASPAF